MMCWRAPIKTALTKFNSKAEQKPFLEFLVFSYHCCPHFLANLIFMSANAFSDYYCHTWIRASIMWIPWVADYIFSIGGREVFQVGPGIFPWSYTENLEQHTHILIINNNCGASVSANSFSVFCLHCVFSQLINEALLLFLVYIWNFEWQPLMYLFSPSTPSGQLHACKNNEEKNIRTPPPPEFWVRSCREWQA